MRARILPGSVIAMSAVALTLAGAAPALAKHHRHPLHKAKASCKQETPAAEPTK